MCLRNASIVLLFFFASAAAEDTTNNLVDNDNWSIDGDVYTCTDCKWNGAGQSMDQNADIIWVYSDEQGTANDQYTKCSTINTNKFIG